jgi:hypothetical protein
VPCSDLLDDCPVCEIPDALAYAKRKTGVNRYQTGVEETIESG